jgi:imidazolonepropionase-like amidohydrolase
VFVFFTLTQDITEVTLLPSLLLKGGTVLSGGTAAWIPHRQDILFKAGRVHSICENLESPECSETLNCQGKFVIPGLIDAHTHLGFNGYESLFKLAADPHDRLVLEAPRALRVTLESGITTVRDVGARDYIDVALKHAVRDGILPGPRMIVSGKMITGTGGHCWVIAREADGIEDIRKATREQIKAGADLVKLMVTGGGATPGQNVESTYLSLDEIKAACDVAHEAFRRVAAHAHGATGIKKCVLGGVNSVEHCSLLDEEGAALMAEHGVYMVVTLGHESMFPDIDPDWQKRVGPIRDRAPVTIALARKHGLKIVAGSDAGGNPYAPHGKFAFLLGEMIRTGMPAEEVMDSCTVRAAELLEMSSEIGRLAEGLRADAVVVDHNPLESISTLESPFAVIKDGVVVAHR